ncbi:hypothetical protein HZB94_02355 [Candidatus Falkowbacteria bacterium]|nr:hypothetical protein [Candidatus Falkowbacteria bacterium]
MTTPSATVVLSAPEREIFDIIFNNAVLTTIGPKTVNRFAMQNGELRQEIGRLAQTFFDGAEADARGAIETCVEKLLSAGCVRLVGRRKDAEPPGVIQIERPREEIAIISKEQQEEEEKMAVTESSVAEFLKAKRQELVDIENEKMRQLVDALGTEKKKIGEAIASGQEVDAARYNALREAVVCAQTAIRESPLVLAYEQVIESLSRETEKPETAPTAAEPAAPAKPTTKRQYRRMFDASWQTVVKILASDPHFGAGGEGTLDDIERVLRSVDPKGEKFTRRDISFRLNDAMSAGVMEKRALSPEEKKEAGSGRLQNAFKLTAHGRTFKSADKTS